MLPERVFLDRIIHLVRLFVLVSLQCRPLLENLDTSRWCVDMIFFVVSVKIRSATAETVEKDSSEITLRRVMKHKRLSRRKERDRRQENKL